MGKLRIVDVPDFKPHKCGNCGSSKADRKYIDFDNQVDWYGTFYLCSFCLNEAAQFAGLFDKINEELEELKAKILEHEDLKEQASQIHETVRNLAENLEALYVSLHSSGPGDNLNYTDSDHIAEISEPEDSGDSVKSDSGVKKPESRAVKQNSSGRSKDVRSLADLLDRD